VCRSRLKREDFQEVKTKVAIIESSSDEEYAYTIKKKTAITLIELPPPYGNKLGFFSLVSFGAPILS
jgi:hypothetical protein